MSPGCFCYRAHVACRRRQHRPLCTMRRSLSYNVVMIYLNRCNAMSSGYGTAWWTESRTPHPTSKSTPKCPNPQHFERRFFQATQTQSKRSNASCTNTFAFVAFELFTTGETSHISHSTQKFSVSHVNVLNRLSLDVYLITMYGTDSWFDDVGSCDSHSCLHRSCIPSSVLIVDDSWAVLVTNQPTRSWNCP